MTPRTRRIRFLPKAFAALTQVFALFVLVGLAGAAPAHAHQIEGLSSVAVQASEIACAHERCHAADQAAVHADCAPSMCCGLSALAGDGGRDMPPASATLRPLIGPMDFASRPHPPVPHPPTTI